MSRGMDPVNRIDLQMSGATSYLHTKVRLREHIVSDFPELLQAAQALNPAVDAEALVRTIWRLGSRAAQRNNERHVPIRTSDLPYARRAADDEALQARRPPSRSVPAGLRPSR